MLQHIMCYLNAIVRLQNSVNAQKNEIANLANFRQKLSSFDLLRYINNLLIYGKYKMIDFSILCRTLQIIP